MAVVRNSESGTVQPTLRDFDTLSILLAMFLLPLSLLSRACPSRESGALLGQSLRRWFMLA